jgi:hypothetical protein
MTILKRQLHQTVRGSLPERVDWVRLCYDTDTRGFSIEHEWHQVDPYQRGTGSDKGREATGIEGYRGSGAGAVADAKAALLSEAGHEA